MATVHATLTGADLHEPKGVASAAANNLYLTNGSGSGTFVNQNTLGGAFGGKLYHVRDQQSQNTIGQSYTALAWTTVRLNTEVVDDISASLTLNQISLPSGTYIVQGSVPYSAVSGGEKAKLRLRNVTAGSDLILSPHYVRGVASGGGFFSSDTMRLPIAGRFTLAATTTVELQIYSTNGVPSAGAALDLTGYPEIYSELFIWKVA